MCFAGLLVFNGNGERVAEIFRSKNELIEKLQYIAEFGEKDFLLKHLSNYEIKETEYKLTHIESFGISVQSMLMEIIVDIYNKNVSDEDRKLENIVMKLYWSGC